MTRTRSRALVAAVLAAACVAVAGCGGDDDIGDGGARTEGGEPVTTTATGEKTTPATTPDKPPPTEPRTTDVPPPSRSPEDEPGGGGDEEPARTEVKLTASGSSVRPRGASVAPFISVRITFVSRGPGQHTLSIGGEKLVAGEDTPPVTLTLDGLRPGQAYTGRLNTGATVRILATNEPGP